jgi:hypothetical protein
MFYDETVEFSNPLSHAQYVGTRPKFFEFDKGNDLNCLDTIQNSKKKPRLQTEMPGLKPLQTQTESLLESSDLPEAHEPPEPCKSSKEQEVGTSEIL